MTTIMTGSPFLRDVPAADAADGKLSGAGAGDITAVAKIIAAFAPLIGNRAGAGNDDRQLSGLAGIKRFRQRLNRNDRNAGAVLEAGDVHVEHLGAVE